ncbi:unnamed protein product [Lampetra fluviatilis]
MSKHLKKRNPPDPPSDGDDDEDEAELLGTTGPLPPTADLPDAAPKRHAGAEASPAMDERWQRVAEHIESLRAVMLNFVTVIALSAALDRPHETRPSADDLDVQWGAVTAITPAAEEEAAILGGVTATLPAAAILAEPCAARVAGTSTPKDSDSGCSHRLPH